MPAYVKTFQQGLLKQKATEAHELLRCCKLCPRNCQVNRLLDEQGVCKTGGAARVASALPHFGEEDCLRGSRGSGTIFFAGCNLQCVFCQNHEISQIGQHGKIASAQLATAMLRLQESGCHNLNLVTPSHVAPQILEALTIAVAKGFRLPLVFNTSGYESVETIRLMDGVVDIYMPDFKLWGPRACALYLRAHSYGETARAAIKKMHDQVGILKMDENGLALRGVLVRHLVMPGLLEDTRLILDWLAGELSPDTYLNLMDQYHPAHRVQTEQCYSAINRMVPRAEFRAALDYAVSAGLWRLDAR